MVREHEQAAGPSRRHLGTGRVRQLVPFQIACSGAAIITALEIADVRLLARVRQLVSFQIACLGAAEVAALEVADVRLLARASTLVQF